MLTFLFVLRLISAVALLAFLGVLAWLIQRDMRITAEALMDQSRPRGALIVLKSEAASLTQGQQLALLPVTGIGRAASNTIMIDDEYASLEHALIMMRGQQWWAEDLNSFNGTLLNGQTLSKPTVLSSGDVVIVGTTHLRVEL